MKKLILFAIFAVLIAPNAHAASASVTDAGQNSSYTCYEVSGTAVGQDDTSLTPDIDASTCAGTETVLYNSRGPSGITTSNIQKKKSCTSCKSGYNLTVRTGISTRAKDCEVTWYTCDKDIVIKPLCEGLPCQGTTIWKDDPDNEYRQFRCVVTGGEKCEYQCKTNSYNAGGTLFGPPNCKKCPDHGECYGTTTPPCCSKGYYLIDNNWVDPSGGVVQMRPKDYDCLRCPGIFSLGAFIQGTTRETCPIEPPAPSYITMCYLPSGNTIRATEGIYTLSGDCHYSTDD